MTSSATPRCCPRLLSDPLDETEAEKLASVLKALADPVRVRLMSIIASAQGGEMCTCDLPAMIGRSQGTVSHHLSILTGAGLIRREQRGKWAWFRVEPSTLDELSEALSPSPTTGPRR